MISDIVGTFFFEWLLKDGEIDPDSGYKWLQDEDGELSDNASQLTPKMIKYPKDNDIPDSLFDQPSDEYSTEAISEGGQYAFQTSVTSVENPVSDPISKHFLLCSEI